MGNKTVHGFPVHVGTENAGWNVACFDERNRYARCRTMLKWSIGMEIGTTAYVMLASQENLVSADEEVVVNSRN